MSPRQKSPEYVEIISNRGAVGERAYPPGQGKAYPVPSRRSTRIAAQQPRKDIRHSRVQRQHRSAREWEVTAITGSGMSGNTTTTWSLNYQIRWATGYSTWEVAENLTHCDAALAEYHQRRKFAPGRAWAAKKLFPNRRYSHSLFSQWLAAHDSCV